MPRLRLTFTRTSLAMAGALVALQGLGLIGVALFYVLEVAMATTSDLARAVATAMLALLAGAGLLIVGRGLAVGNRWARAPALVTNLILVPVAVGLLQDRWYIGLPLLAWAATVAVLLFTPAVNAGLDATDPDHR